jgi:sulfonate transport system substrate-binding protein
MAVSMYAPRAATMLFWLNLVSASPLVAEPALPEQVPAGTTLVIGHPEIQQALQLSGEIDKLPFKIVWANISSGPNTIAAFRAHALDLGAVGEIRPFTPTGPACPSRSSWYISVRMPSITRSAALA